MARYVLSKDNDKIILTDTKTGKKRILSIDDIDYVVDDNQKLRDENTIATYFRLKEEDFKPKTMTKKANLVQEYKQATTKEKADTFDYVGDFLEKAKLLPSEIKSLAELPDESTINKFNRPQQEKDYIIRLFQEMKNDLDKKKINTFDFIKSYLNHNQKFDLESKYDDLNAFVHDLLPELPKEQKINNLQELYDMGIKKVGNIDLEKLNEMIMRLNVLTNKNLSYNKKKYIFYLKNPIDIDYYKNREKDMYNIDDLKTLFNSIKQKLNSHFGRDLLNEKTQINNINLTGANNLRNVKDRFIQLMNEINKYLETKKYFIDEIIDKPVLGLYKNQFNGVDIHSLLDNKLKYFDNLNKIEQAANIIAPGYIKIYMKSVKNIDDIDKIKDFVFPPIHKMDFDSKNLPIYLFNDFNSYIGQIDPDWKERENNRDDEIVAEGFGAGENLAGSWTDKTLTRIDVIIDTLKGMGIGMGWSDKTLSRIDRIISQLKGMGDEIAGGWTDKTLNRIEIIMDILKGMGNGVILTDKDLEYY